MLNPYSEYLSRTTYNEDIYVEDGMSELGRDFKRITDFIVAAFCLVFFSPLFLICYIAVKLDDGGPAVFSQERIGLHGKPFVIYKFRSMRVDAERDGPRLVAHETDSRMTKVGRFLRDHHLDELPQLWNVLKGEMSLVGPRPMMPNQRILYPGSAYYSLRPGITGSWQVMQRNRSSFADRAWYDTQYHRDVSLRTDISLLLATVRVVMKATGH